MHDHPAVQSISLEAQPASLRCALTMPRRDSPLIVAAEASRGFGNGLTERIRNRLLPGAARRVGGDRIAATSWLSSPEACMSGERFDYTSERQRHEKFVGREALLARVDELLVEGGADRWVVITGGPGMGKSAIHLHRRSRRG
jgi:hypothetical protein